MKQISLAATGFEIVTIRTRKRLDVAAPPSTKNWASERDPEMHQTRKGNQWHFGMKAHIGVDIGTAANVNDVTQGHRLLHGEETDVFADARYQGAMKPPEATGRVLGRSRGGRQIEKFKAGICVKVRYRSLAKNTAQLVTLFALSNLWMARKRLIEGMPG